jgi:hypothetical protein
MGIIRKAFLGSILAPATAVGYVYATTTLVSPLPSSDALWTSDNYKKRNVHRNPCVNDICFKKVSLDRIRPELLQKEGDLVLGLTRGLFSGWGEQSSYYQCTFRNCDSAIEMHMHMHMHRHPMY